MNVSLIKSTIWPNISWCNRDIVMTSVRHFGINETFTPKYLTSPSGPTTGAVLYPLDTGGTLRELKKISKEPRSHGVICMWSWESSKFEPFSFPCFSLRNINHMSKTRERSLFLVRKSRESSKFELKKWAFSGKRHVIDISKRKLGILVRILSSLGIFELKKVSVLGFLTCDWYFEEKNKENWMVRILSSLRITCILRHVILAPSMSFWALSGYPPYDDTIFIRIKTGIRAHLSINLIGMMTYNDSSFGDNEGKKCF